MVSGTTYIGRLAIHDGFQREKQKEMLDAFKRRAWDMRDLGAWKPELNQHQPLLSKGKGLAEPASTVEEHSKSC